MYAPPPAVVPASAGRSGGFAAGPILAICCLLFILLLIATTIILALIPVYLPRKDVTTVNSPTYYASGNLDQSPGGDAALDANNRARLANSIAAGTGAPAGAVTVPNAAIQGQAGRRKRRKLGLIRNRRDEPKASVFTLFIVINFNIRRCISCGLAGFASKLASFPIIVELFVFGVLRSFRCLLRFSRFAFFDIVAISVSIAGNTDTTTTASVTQSVG